MEAVLTDCVQNSLRYFLHQNAIFMCERLCAEFPSETKHAITSGLLFAQQSSLLCIPCLKSQMAESRYLFAISCFQMDLLNEAEAALVPSNDPSAEVPNGAAGHYLLGLVYRYTDRRQSAVHHFNQALSIDPLLWAAYEELCVLGAAAEAASVFGEVASACIQQYLIHDLAPLSLQASVEDHNIISARQPGVEEVSPRHLRRMHGNNQKDSTGNHHGVASSGGVSLSHNGGHTNMSYYNTPSPMAAQLTGLAPPPICRNLPENGPNQTSAASDGSPRSTINSTRQAPRRKFVDEGKLRKISGRLFSDSGPRRITRLAAEAGANVNSSVSTVTGNGNCHSSKYLASSKLSSSTFRSVTVRKGQTWGGDFDEGMRNVVYDDSRSNVTASSSSPSVDSRVLEHEGATTTSTGGATMNATRLVNGASEILSLLRTLGEGHRLYCIYRCQDALDIFLKLPHKHYNTGWVLCQVGKAHFELVDYLEANRAFSQARLVSPYSLEGADIYSTVLYHLKEDMKLSYLAQELISTDRLAPQTWCAMGNCYSLQKDHDTALKIFQRALQLNSRFAYAHTLCGHEYVALEDFENGIKSYQSALRVDARHYKAWYGLGMIYFRQEKFEFSEHHFRKAFQINPRSSVIMSYLGTALHELKRNMEALVIMEKAITADKENLLPMYQKANILLSMEDFDAALEVLEELKEYAPRESSVYALMGKIYKRLHIYDKAMLHFGLALDLKPSATDVATIKGLSAIFENQNAKFVAGNPGGSELAANTTSKDMAAIEKLHVPDELADEL